MLGCGSLAGNPAAGSRSGPGATSASGRLVLNSTSDTTVGADVDAAAIDSPEFSFSAMIDEFLDSSTGGSLANLGASLVVAGA